MHFSTVAGNPGIARHVGLLILQRRMPLKEIPVWKTADSRWRFQMLSSDIHILEVMLSGTRQAEYSVTADVSLQRHLLLFRSFSDNFTDCTVGVDDFV